MTPRTVKFPSLRDLARSNMRTMQRQVISSDPKNPFGYQRSRTREYNTFGWKV